MSVIYVIIFSLGPLMAMSQTASDSTSIICPAETMPQFPGGSEMMRGFIAKNLNYPKTGMCVEGKVFVGFVVETDGSITSVKTIKGIHPLFDAEAERVVSLFPKWIPGNVNGKKVPVKMVMPISFSAAH